MNEPITIRHSRDGDRARVLELAELDDRPAPVGDTLVAEVGGRLWAAVGIDDGGAVADPFRPAGDLVMLLHVRAEQERVTRAARAPDPPRERTPASSARARSQAAR
jgi:hypothetical protein